MAHLEDLIVEWYDINKYAVYRNITVAKRAKGGWGCELDVVAHSVKDNRLIHIEASLDAHSWPERERRFEKKFAAGRASMFVDVVPWLDPNTPIEQIAILAAKRTTPLAGARVRSVDEFLAEIVTWVRARGPACRTAIPEKYPLLRAIQLAIAGYNRVA